MQLIAMIMSFIFGRMNKQTQGLRESAVEIFEEVIEKSRKVVTLTLTGLGAVTFFCGGIFIALINATTQYDRNGYVAFTSTLGAGIGLVLFAAIGFALVFARAWPGARKKIEVREEIHSQPPQSGLEHAISALVMDFVKERELRRQQPTHTQSPASATSHTGTTNANDIPQSGPMH